MARVPGRHGMIYAGIATSAATPTPLFYMNKFDLDFSTERTEVTAFGDTNKVYVNGLPDSSGTFEGYWDSATNGTYTAAIDGDPRGVYFYPTTPSSAGPYWWGTGYLDFKVSVDVGGVVMASGTFTPAGAMTKVG